MEHTKRRTSSYTYNDNVCIGERERVKVPFSWEYEPGLSRATRQLSNNDTRRAKLVLQPPPCSSSSGTASDRPRTMDEKDTETSVILCAFQPPLRISSFRMESQKEEDPFLEAYKKCTKSPFIPQRSSKGQKNNNGSWPGLRKYMHILSCKHAGDVTSMV